MIHFFCNDGRRTCRKCANEWKKRRRMDGNLEFLREECRNKDKIINSLLENLFEREITNASYKNNSANILLSKKSETEFRNPKCSLKINNMKNILNREPIIRFNSFDCHTNHQMKFPKPMTQMRN